MKRKLKRLRIANKKINKTDFSKVENLASISNSHLAKSTFEATNLQNLKIKNSNLTKVNLKKCLMGKTQVIHSDMAHSDWEFSNLTGVKWFRSNFTKSNLQCTALQNAVINESSLKGADMRWANLTGTVFSKTDLSNVDLCNANLKNTRFIECKLKGAKYNLNTQLPFSNEMAKSMGMKNIPLM